VSPDRSTASSSVIAPLDSQEKRIEEPLAGRGVVEDLADAGGTGGVF
jgi:hypothetical protein